MATLLQDLRLGFRSLVKSPGFALAAILTLALGIGCNGMIFSIVNALLLRPYPYPDPEELVILTKGSRQEGTRSVRLSPREYHLLRDNAKSFENVAAVEIGETTLSGTDEPMRVKGARATASTFEVIGGPMTLGRGFSASEDSPGGDRVVVLSESLWQARFGADRGILGRAVNIDGAPFTVVGVVPVSAQFPDTKDAQLLVPLQADPSMDRPASLLVIGRLGDGVEIGEAEAEMRTLGARLAEGGQDAEEGWSVDVQALRDFRSGDSRPALLLALIAVFLVLLVACANVANLLLQRGVVRAREMAIRTALGGGRARLVRQLLTESLVLAVLGCLLGVPIAAVLVKLFVGLMPADRMAGYMSFGIDGVVIAYLAGLSLLTVALFSLLPSLRATRVNLHEELGESGGRASGGRRRRRMQAILMVSEIGLSLVLLVTAGLLIQSFRKLQDVSPGFDTRNVLAVPVQLPRAKYPDEVRRAAAYEAILARTAAVPGVRSVGASGYIPVMDWGGAGVLIEGQAMDEQENNPVVGLQTVAGSFFQALGLPLLRGRSFTPKDVEGTPPVVVINQTMAEYFWQDQDPVGKRIKLDPEGEWLQIVGVVGDVKSWGLDNQAPLDLYLPYRQSEIGETLNLLVRTESDPMSVLPSIRRAVAGIDPEVPLDGAETMTRLIDSTLWRQRITSVLFSIFAVFALFLAAVGIYGTMSYSVAQRRYEIGIRMALGAQIRDVLGMVLRQALRLVVIGILAGAVAAFAMAKLVSSQLFGVSSADPVTFLGVAVLMAAVALLATFLPAQRAARVAPVIALHDE